eukprot:GHVU01117900.1.p4 GENE.GHVU01117900.1~~GHVU01117900.1.p4  ORF type:complete len:115 (+),score=5.38 GHVU01117900.1:427-771(+)
MLEIERPLRRMNEICCPDCAYGDITCLYTCKKTDCEPTPNCAEAGRGAHAAYCTKKCAICLKYHSPNCGSTFLPIPACQGQCAATAGLLCQTENCSKYGCNVPECAAEVGKICG